MTTLNDYTNVPAEHDKLISMSVQPIHIDLTPNWDRYFDSMRYFQYSNYGAIQDIVDNGVDAGADTIRVEITKVPKCRKNNIEKIIIADNGCGMSQNVLIEALKLGSNTTHNAGDLGRFGMGLITASISMARRLSVITRENASSPLLKGVFDVDAVKNTKSPCGVLCAASKDEHDLFDRLVNNESGTIVVLEKLDKLTSNHAYNFANTLRGKTNMARTYRLKIGEESIDFFVNNDKVIATDVSGWYEKDTIRFCTGWETAAYNGIDFKYRATYQPPKTLGSGGSVTGRARTAQGAVSIFRNGREIDFGKTFGIYKNTTNHTGFHVEFCFPAELDSALGIGVQKTNVNIEQGLLDTLTKLVAPMKTLATKAYKKYIVSGAFTALGKKQQSFADRLSNIDDIIVGLPPRPKKKKSSTSSMAKKVANKKIAKSGKTRSKKPNTSPYKWNFSLTEEWPSDDIMFEADMSMDDNEARMLIDIIINAKHPMVANHYLESDNQELMHKFISALAITKITCHDDHVGEFNKLFRDLSINLANFESSKF